MKIIVLGGFLGAGKTTVLMQYARFLTEREKGRTDVPVIILENEISEAGVDNQLLSQANFTVENIFSGCVCCSSSATLKQSVEKIEKQYHPEWLLIEATGMAYPDSIRQNLEADCHMQSSILALADAKRWKRVIRAMHDFVSAQLTDADVILLNKVDLVDEQTADEAAEEIRTFNAAADLYRISAIEQQSDEMWEKVTQKLELGNADRKEAGENV